MTITNVQPMTQQVYQKIQQEITKQVLEVKKSFGVEKAEAYIGTYTPAGYESEQLAITFGDRKMEEPFHIQENQTMQKLRKQVVGKPYTGKAEVVRKIATMSEQDVITLGKITGMLARCKTNINRMIETLYVLSETLTVQGHTVHAMNTVFYHQHTLKSVQMVEGETEYTIPKIVVKIMNIIRRNNPAEAGEVTIYESEQGYCYKYRGYTIYTKKPSKNVMEKIHRMIEKQEQNHENEAPMTTYNKKQDITLQEGEVGGYPAMFYQCSETGNQLAIQVPYWKAIYATLDKGEVKMGASHRNRYLLSIQTKQSQTVVAPIKTR